VSLHLDSATVAELCTEEVALKAAQFALDAQRRGEWVLPSRLDVDVPSGFFRVMVAALGDIMGAKIMTLAKGVGNRYLLLVCRQATGELIATLDAAEVTRRRTAATTAMAGALLHPAGTSTLGLIGTGFEADAHLRAFAKLWPLDRVVVFSPSAGRREAFAARLGAELQISVTGVDTVAQVVAEAPVSVLCTKSTEPVVRGEDFAKGAVVLSIGSTRRDLRELSDSTFSRAAWVLVDDPAQVAAESGDVASALSCGAISKDQLVPMQDWSPRAREGDRDLLVFKSVGTAVQDLALASVLIEEARARGVGREIGELAELKPSPLKGTHP
jgi:alanine dehydrogenase